jgi:TPR repeat protein/ribosomal protein S14
MDKRQLPRHPCHSFMRSQVLIPKRGRRGSLAVANRLVPTERIPPRFCEACAERGRPNEPVHKIGLCRFCFHGLPHPEATAEQQTTERIGGHESDFSGSVLKRKPMTTRVRRIRSEEPLARMREDLALLRAELAERELFLAHLRAELSAFEGQYLRLVGTLYAELDEWNVKIAEWLANVDGTGDARSAVAQARAQGEESGSADAGAAVTVPEFVSSAELKTIYRLVVSRVHPALTTDEYSRHKCEQRMAEAYAAYPRSDADVLMRILDEYESVPGSAQLTSIALDLVRGNLQITQVKSRRSQIEMEVAIVSNSDIAKLSAKADAAKTEGRELLAELAQDLSSRIEFLRSAFELGCPGSSMTKSNKRPRALMPGEPDLSCRNGTASLAARGSTDLRTNEEAEGWRLQVPFRREDGLEGAARCFRTGFELRASHAGSQFVLGCAYVRGLGVPQDYCQAAVWFRKAAEQGHAHAANNLGALCEHGVGVAQGYEQAFDSYFNAAGQGVAIAQVNLDRIYWEGRNVTLGFARAAARWYRMVAEKLDVIDQRNLGLMYAQGKGVPQDDGEAAFWFRNAAEQGDAMAQENLGLMYALGKGVPKDRTEAVFWCCKAAQQGYEPARHELSALSRQSGHFVKPRSGGLLLLRRTTPRCVA